MRLWSIHPCYLDRQGLLALWRESLLAQKVLLGATRGYTNHPQLLRFKNSSHSVGAIAEYLNGVAMEGACRGYRFDRGKIVQIRFSEKIVVTSGQIRYEFKHLLKKLKIRDPAGYEKYVTVRRIALHPLFRETGGEVEEWEKAH